MIEVIPGILEQNFSSIVEKVRQVEGFCPWIQIDLLDGTLFGNTSFHNPAGFANLRTTAKLELHMMVVNPAQLVDEWARVGFKRFIAHIEGITDAEGFIATVRSKPRFNRGKKLEVGLAVDITTDISILEPYLPNIDVVLVMSVHTGESGQQFDEHAAIKIRKIRTLNSEISIEVDGGITPDNARKVVQAGATRLVSTSYIFNSPHVLQAIRQLQQV